MKKLTHETIACTLAQFVNVAGAQPGGFSYAAGYLESALGRLIAELPAHKQKECLMGFEKFIAEKAVKINLFPTLAAALQSEDLDGSWELHFGGLSYGETRSWTHEDGTHSGHYITVTRTTDGMYERPVHYAR